MSPRKQRLSKQRLSKQRLGKQRLGKQHLGTRRQFLGAASATGIAAFSGCVANPSAVGDLGYPFGPVGEPVDGSLLPTVACLESGDDPVSTDPATAGPFYTPDTPRRRSFVDDAMPGAVPLRIAGRVLDTSCRLIAGAVIDFWHCDEDAVYDEQGFLFRGHQYTDESGAFDLTTVKPPPYMDGTFRSPHVHVVVQGPDTQLLTTQIFFAEDTADHARDSLFDPDLVTVNLGEAGGVSVVHFDFVLVPSAS